MDRLKRQQSVDGLALEVALWFRYCSGVADDATAIEIVDVTAKRLQERALAAKSYPSAFLAMQDIFGSLGEKGTFIKSLNALWATGTMATLTAYQRQAQPMQE